MFFLENHSYIDFNALNYKNKDKSCHKEQNLKWFETLKLEHDSDLIWPQSILEVK